VATKTARGVLALWLGALLLAGGTVEAVGANASETDTNAICPVMEGNPVDPNIFVEYEGKRVYFCCNRCKALFSEDPAAYLARLPQFAEADPVSQPESHVPSGLDVPAAPGQSAAPEVEREEANRLVRFLGKFHPVVVHFPIALLLTALLAEVLSVAVRKPVFSDMGRLCLVFGAISGLFAMALGFAAEGSVLFTGALDEALETHETLGIAATIAALATAIAAAWPVREARKRAMGWVYRMGLAASAVLVAATGYFGGTLVYGLNHFKW